MKFSAFVLATAAATASAQFLGNPFSNVFGAGAYPVQYQQQFAYPQQQYNAYPMVQPQADPLAWERDCSWINSLNFRAALSRATCGVDVCVTQGPQGNGGGSDRTASGSAAGFHVWGTVINRAGRVCAIAYTGSDVSQQFPFGRIQSAKKANTANSLSLPTRASPNHIAVPIETNAGFAHDWDLNGPVPGFKTMNPAAWLDRRYVAANHGGAWGQNAAKNTNAVQANSDAPAAYFGNSLAYQIISSQNTGDGVTSTHPVEADGPNFPLVPLVIGNPSMGLFGGADYQQAGDVSANLNQEFQGWGAGGGVKVPSDRRALAGYPLRTNNVNDVDTKDDEHWSGFSMPMSPGNLAIHYQGAASNYGEPCGNTRQDPMCMQKPGGYDYHAGGLALYDAQGVLRGAIGVAGDNDCANHAIAWKAREQLLMDYTPAGSQADGLRESRRLYVGWMQPPNILPATSQSRADHKSHYDNFFVRDPWQTWKVGNVGAKAEDNIAFHVRPLSHSASPPITLIGNGAASLAAADWGAKFTGSMYPGGGIGHDRGGIENALDQATSDLTLATNTYAVFNGGGWLNTDGMPGLVSHGLYGQAQKGDSPWQDKLGINENGLIDANIIAGFAGGNVPTNGISAGRTIQASDTYSTGGRHIVNPQGVGIGAGWEHTFFVASISRAFGMESVQDGDECTTLPCVGVKKDNTKETTPVTGVNRLPFAKSVTFNNQAYGNYDWTLAHQGDGPYIYCAVMVSDFYVTNPTATSVFSASK